MSIRGFLKRQPGLVASGTGHAAILVASLVAFASAPPFADQQESVAVEMITPTEYTAMTRGERTAQDLKPEPKPKVDKVAETAEEKPQSAEAPRDVPTPPSRPPAPAAEKTEAAPPPPPQQQAKAEPPKPTPPKPEPPKPEPAKVEPPKPEPVKEAEPKPEPPKRPEPPKQAEAKPEPKKPEPKKPDPPKTVEKPAPKREDLAKLIEDSAPKEKPATAKPAEQESKFNPSDIQKLLQSKEKAQRAASTGREVNRTASIGTRTGSSPKLSLSQRDAIGNLLKEQIYRCFNAPLGAQSVSVKPMVKMELNPDGTLATQPVVMNSSGEPGFRPFAESLARAIRRCAPYRIPAQFAPYYADWRDFQVIADPSDFLG
ncbi:cell envelope biogenesis protein TolA [Chelatococcus sp. GCM10030263]|uniref:cell envelope biogenesis protein TolA n=1 Tax=Chelatococcus sp. GCM10030263 TaxID=3273387 RepID=UPI00361CB224